MPAAKRSINARDVERHVREHAFSATGRTIGIEAEWFAYRTSRPGEPIAFEDLRSTVEGLGGIRSRVTFEPGGQLELSTPASPDLAGAVDAIAHDIASIRGAVRPLGLTLEAVGVDPVRPHRRVLHTPRYAAMERYFDSGGPAGRRMMCRTAAVQINLDPGAGSLRWRLAHAIGPVLVAAFANSPFVDGRRTPWRSSRMATWWAMDRTRTSPVPFAGDPFVAWTRYVLEANVMLIRLGDDRFEPVMETLPFERWIAEGHRLGFPTMEDLDYHLTTLFPPVRPRGWLELRMVDAVPDPWWSVATAVAAAVLYAGDTRDLAAIAGPPLWLESFTEGLAHPAIAASARRCFDIASRNVAELGATAETIEAVRAFDDRYVRRGRCPADDLIDASPAGTVGAPFATIRAPIRS